MLTDKVKSDLERRVHKGVNLLNNVYARGLRVMPWVNVDLTDIERCIPCVLFNDQQNAFLSLRSTFDPRLFQNPRDLALIYQAFCLYTPREYFTQEQIEYVASLWIAEMRRWGLREAPLFNNPEETEAVGSPEPGADPATVSSVVSVSCRWCNGYGTLIEDDNEGNPGKEIICDVCKGKGTESSKSSSVVSVSCPICNDTGYKSLYSEWLGQKVRQLCVCKGGLSEKLSA